jgi:hypothetical protein
MDTGSLVPASALPYDGDRGPGMILDRFFGALTSSPSNPHIMPA